MDFEIYRPARHPDRLENKYIPAKTNEWRPSTSYKYKLRDIQNQFTPAEYYRHRLATSGKQIRLIQRLEFRIEKNPSLFHKAALKVQARVRGIIGRARLLEVLPQLKEQLLLRTAKITAQQSFDNQDYHKTIEICRGFTITNQLLHYLEMKSWFRLKNYAEAIVASNKYIGIDKLSEEAYYIQSCCYFKLERYDDALDTLDRAYLVIQDPENRFIKLYGYLCLKVHPMKVESALDSFNLLVKRDETDYESLVERACCLQLLQEYTAALEDLNKVLLFVPDHIRAKALRARLYACLRMWDKAKEDYESLMAFPSMVDIAKAGMEDIEEKTNRSEVFVLNSLA